MTPKIFRAFSLLHAWVGVSVLLSGWLAWDAWPWLSGVPGASFRETMIGTEPLWKFWWFLLPAVVWLQRRLRFERQPWFVPVAAHLAVVAIVFGIFLGLYSFRLAVANHLPLSFYPTVLRDYWRRGWWDFQPSIDYVALVVAIYAVDFYRSWRARDREAAELTAGKVELEARLLRANLDALRMQLHPHFLFNALNSVSALIRKERLREAEDAVAGLGDLLRHALERREEQLAPLADEISFLQRYLAIERIRFQDRLIVEIDVADDCRAALVPSLILQPLVENAAKHGLARMPGAARLRIEAKRDGTVLRLAVYNDGPPLPVNGATARGGVGLENTRARLRLLHGDAATLALRDVAGRGVSAEISLPWQTA